MSQARWLWFIAGPNGAGKSTRAAEFLGGLGEIVNPDEIAREMSAAPEQEALGAGRAAIDRRKELLKAGNSFSLETTLSGRTLIRLAQAAKEEGWKVGLLYFGLRSPEQAIERVRLRVKSGGHNVPPDDVRRRYYRSLSNLPGFVALADRAIFVDNSTRQRRRMILEIVEGQVTFRISQMPSWLMKSLPLASNRKRSPRT
jgi:predicted ABC-type ATPase